MFLFLFLFFFNTLKSLVLVFTYIQLHSLTGFKRIQSPLSHTNFFSVKTPTQDCTQHIFFCSPSKISQKDFSYCFLIFFLSCDPKWCLYFTTTKYSKQLAMMACFFSICCCCFVCLFFCFVFLFKIIRYYQSLL